MPSCPAPTCLLAPAKINLTLALKGRRKDGYHFLESLVVPVDLCDRIDVAIRLDGPPATSVTCDSPDVPAGPANLVFRAIEAVRSCCARQFGLCAHLQKRIPVGSGLGGGSSDAAAILLFLSRALGPSLPFSLLHAIGLELGADVPFFLLGRPAIVRGVGELIEPLDWFPDLHLVIAYPGVKLDTGRVYAEADRSLTRAHSESNIPSLVDGRRPLSELLVNDLERPAVRLCPEIDGLKRRLVELGAAGTSMTGSGSAVFGICSDGAAAERIAAELQRDGHWACATRTLAGSPVVG